MSGHKARIRLIQALIAGNPCISSTPAGEIIEKEFNEVFSA